MQQAPIPTPEDASANISEVDTSAAQPRAEPSAPADPGVQTSNEAPPVAAADGFDSFLHTSDTWQDDLGLGVQPNQAPPAGASPQHTFDPSLQAEKEKEQASSEGLEKPSGNAISPVDKSPKTESLDIDPAYLDELFEASKTTSHAPTLTAPTAEDALQSRPITIDGPAGSLPTNLDSALSDEAPLLNDIDPDDLQFVRHANKRMFWRKKSTRLILALVALVLFLLLTAQVAVWQRHTVGAISPTSKVWMQMLCQSIGCTVEPHANLEALSIDSSSFQIISPQNYALSWTLLNSSRLWTQTPALEMVLLDKDENTVIQRVFTPQELGQAPELAPEMREKTTQGLQIDANQPEITGYRLRIFYPD